MTAFELLHPKLMKTLKKFGYHNPTQIQQKAIPIILKGINVLISAPTGSGKTEAALFPIFSKILQNNEVKSVKVLYITPLRALNRDILKRMIAIASDLCISIAIRHGDTSKHERYMLSLKPPIILITTPETFQFLLVGKRLRTFLKNVKWVVIDEVHELIDNKRGTQLFTSLERLENISMHKIQRIALSATIGDLDYTAKIVSGGRKIEVINALTSKNFEIKIEYVPPDDSNPFDKSIKKIKELINNSKNLLIFTNTRNTAETIASKLLEIGGKDLAVHHGSLSKEVRVRAENDFKTGKLKAIICTSSLELGIDVGTVDAVIQYGSPRQSIKLTQRIGRSGHRENLVSKGLMIINEPDDLLEAIVLKRRTINGHYEKPRIHRLALDVLAHQIVGMAIENYPSLNSIYKTLTKSFYFKELTYSKFKEVVNFLIKISLIYIKNGRIIPKRRAFPYYFEAASTIPDVEKLKVIDVSTNRFIGLLDGDFVAATCSIGTIFILAGKPWTVDRIDFENMKIYVYPAPQSSGAIPAWIGEEIPVDYKVAREVGALRRRLANGEYSKILKEYKVAPTILSAYMKYIKEQLEYCQIVPSDKIVFIEKGDKYAVINSCFGTKINYTLGLLLAHRISRKVGKTVIFRIDPYRILLVYARGVRGEHILEVFQTKIDEVETLVKQAVKETELYRWHLLHVLKRFGAIERNSKKPISRSIYRIFEGTVAEEEAIEEILIDKLDIEGIIQVLNLIKRGAIKLKYRDVGINDFSPMSIPILERYYYRGSLIPALPHTTILQTVKKRIFDTKLELICLHCLNWHDVMKAGEVDDNFKCPKCKAKMISITRPDDSINKVRIFRRWLNKLPLSEDERKIAEEMSKSAMLFLTYGRKAVIALAGYGVGPATATKILAKANTIDELIELILNAERKYIRTRVFWS